MALNINGTTGISGVDGSISAPAITGTDSNTGISFPAADTIKFATGGVDIMSITNSGIAGITAGITEFDQWYLTANHTGDTDITSNLSRNDMPGAGSQIGTGMSQSSGIFSFPTTGKYLVIANIIFECAGSDSVFVSTNVTTNNSSYSTHCRAADGNNGTGGRRGSGTSFAFIDVTDITQVKVKFTALSISSGSSIRGATDSFIRTSFLFIRLGDT